MTTTDTIDTDLRETLGLLADVLIPSAEGMPSAREADVAGKWLDRVLGVRPDLRLELSRVLEQAKGRDSADEIHRLQEEDDTGFATLALVVTGGYYLNPRVRRLIGYPGQKPNAPYPDEADFYLGDGLLDPVIERGPIYRPTSG